MLFLIVSKATLVKLYKKIDIKKIINILDSK